MEGLQHAHLALYALPVRPYAGLTLSDAQTLAAQEGRIIRVKEDLDHTGRASFSFCRVNVRLTQDGCVAAARKDRPPKGVGRSSGAGRALEDRSRWSWADGVSDS